MTLASRIISDVDAVFLRTADFAIDATYTKAGSSTVTLKVVLEELSDLASMTPGQAVSANVWVPRSVIAAPEIYDTITADGATWRVDSVSSGDPGMFACQCSTDHRVRPGR